MNKAEQLKKSILQKAIEGKLVAQDETEEPASMLIEKIKAEKEKLVAEKKIKKEKALPVITEEEKPFELPNGWEWVRLGDIAIVKGGKRLPSGHSYSDSKTEYIYVRVADMKNNSISNKGNKYITEETREKIKNYTISKDDLYLTIAGTIGNCGIVPEEFDNMNLTENAVKLTNISINKTFMEKIINSGFYQNQFVENTNKVAQPKLAIERILKTLFPLPPLEEQKRIVEKLNKIMPLIDEYDILEKELTALDGSLKNKLKSSLLQKAIEGKLVEQNENDEPASLLIEKINIEKDKLIAEKKIKKEKPLPQITDDEKPFELPNSWEWVRLGDILTKITDGTHATPKYTSSGVPFLSVKDMSSGYLDFSNTRFISKEEHDELYKRCNPEFGDVLITKVGTTGIPVIVDTDKEFSLFVSVALIKFNQDLIYNKYIVHLINSPYVKELSQSNTKGVGNKNLVLKELKKFPIPLPPLEEQKRIADKLDKLMKLCDEL